MRILAIDPGDKESGWAELENGSVVGGSGVMPNEDMLKWLAVSRKLHTQTYDLVAIEMIASYGMPVGREVFETCVWIGRFKQAWHQPDAVQLVYRQHVKMAVCKNARAKDPHIRQALIDLLGPQGTKKNPGPTYGVKSHAWAALAVAVTVAENSVIPAGA